jgi:acyl-coenzyme A synthetase/AMP-(fatty) acid ligase
MPTLPALLETIPGDRTAIVLPEDGTRVSYQSLREQVQDVANVFASMGIGRGDRVAMALPNGLPAPTSSSSA